MTQANDPKQPASAAPVEQELGLAAERDAVLRQLDDRTNQTWAAKRERWAALVRAQDAEIQRLRADLAEMTADRDSWADQASQRLQDALDLMAAERERWRAAAEYAAHQLEQARIWGGTEWHYNALHPLHYRSALERLRDVLRAYAEVTGRP